MNLCKRFRATISAYRASSPAHRATNHCLFGRPPRRYAPLRPPLLCVNHLAVSWVALRSPSLHKTAQKSCPLTTNCRDSPRLCFTPLFLSVAGPVQAHLVDQGRGPHDGQIWLRRPRLSVNRKAGLLRRPRLSVNHLAVSCVAPRVCFGACRGFVFPGGSPHEFMQALSRNYFSLSRVFPRSQGDQSLSLWAPPFGVTLRCVPRFSA